MAGTMEKELILVTGVTGYIAGRTAEALLQAGYRVRGTVRDLSSARQTQKALDEFGSQFEIAVVADIRVAGALDEAMEGCFGVVQIAAPMKISGQKAIPAVEEAVNIVNNVLESASEHQSVETVVLMSSVSAIRRSSSGPYTFTEKDWNTEVEAIFKTDPDKMSGGMIYRAAKVAAERAFWKYRETNKPRFAMAAVNPSFVHGPPLVVPNSVFKIKGTTGFIVSIQAGLDGPDVFKAYPWWVDVRDVARAVVFCVQNHTDGERFLAVSAYGPQQAVADVLRSVRPNSRVEKGVPGEGYAMPGYQAPENEDQILDGSKLVRVTGQDYIPYEQSVVDTANAYEPLLANLGPSIYIKKLAQKIFSYLMPGSK
jgi:nucleoside-diphosphate-sugar epimerase